MKLYSTDFIKLQTSTMKKILALALFALLIIGIQSCVKDNPTQTELVAPNLPATPYDYATLNLPVGAFPASAFNNFGFIDGDIFFPDINRGEFLDITNEKATLGRVLFYDKHLSLNNSISCGSCHHQDKGFADGQQFSIGFEGKVTERNSMAIVNPITQNNLFWDSRSFSIADLSLKPVQNHIEMGMEDLDYLKDKLQAIDYYPALFKEAFGTSDITSENISQAISAFVGSITTNQSKFDEGLQTNFTNFNDLEKLGHQIFNSEKAKCGTCHSNNLFAADDNPGGEYGGGDIFNPTTNNDNPRGTTNIGLELEYADNGRGDGKFKIPSLRNVALTGPYMHDGRFKTLEEVIDHYSEGIKPHKDLDKKFKNDRGDVIHLNLSSVEKTALIAFLHTLTDYEMIKDPKYSDPFKH